MAEIAKLPLRTLAINGARKLDRKALAPLNGHPTIHTLDFFYSDLSDDALAEFSRYRLLSHRGLNSSTVSDGGLQHLAGVKFPRGVVLTGTKVTEAGVNKLAAAQPETPIIWDRGTIPPRTK